MNFTNNYLLKRMDDLAPSRVCNFPEVTLPVSTGKEMLGTIVLAESDPSDLEHIASLLENLHFEVLTAMDGKTALDLIREHHPVVVISSMLLPNIDGYRLAQKLRADKETEGIPFMLVVQTGELPDQLIGHETYAHDYIQKPISVPEFTSRVKALYNLVRRKRPAADRVVRTEEWSLERPLLSQKVGRTQGGLLQRLDTRAMPPAGSGASRLDSQAEVFSRMREFLLSLERCLDQLQFQHERLGEQSMPKKNDEDGRFLPESEPASERKQRREGTRVSDSAAEPLSDLDQFRSEYRKLASEGPMFTRTPTVAARGIEDIFARFLGPAATEPDTGRKAPSPEAAGPPSGPETVPEPEPERESAPVAAAALDPGLVPEPEPEPEPQELFSGLGVDVAPPLEPSPPREIQLPDEVESVLAELAALTQEFEPLPTEPEEVPPTEVWEEASQRIEAPEWIVPAIADEAAEAKAAEPREAEPEPEAEPEGSLEVEPEAALSAEATSEVPVEFPPEELQFSDDAFFDPELLRQLNVKLAPEPVSPERNPTQPAVVAPVGAASAAAEPEEAPLYDVAVSFVMDAILSAASGDTPNREKGLKLADRMVDAMHVSPELLLSSTQRRQDFSVSAHSVNVAVLAIAVARALGRPERYLKRVCLAGLLHEVGVVKLPEKLMFKESAVGEPELKLLKNRPLFSADLLQDVGAGLSWLPEIVGQVYERLNGKGKPLGLRGASIFEESQVLGLADAFEACIHPRPFRPEPISGYQALYELTSDRTGAFAPKIVQALVQAVSLFPVNEVLVLSSGETVRVIGTNSDAPARPVVEVWKEPGGQVASTTRVIDLNRKPDLKIVEVLPVSRW